MLNRVIFATFLISNTIFISQCAFSETPEKVIETVRVEIPKEVVVTKEVEIVVTRIVEVEAPGTTPDKTVVEFWTNENSENQIIVYEEIAASFMEKNPEIDVRIVPIDDDSLFQRLTTAQNANRMPDIIRVGVEQIIEFTTDGIFDEDATEKAIQIIGRDDFRSGLLGLITNPVTGKPVAVPFDGWIQGIWYRSDIFKKAGLNPPTTYDSIMTACESLPGTENLIYALGLGTDPNQIYSHQLFEQFAISNNAWPFDDEGNVTMNNENMVNSLRFYTELQKCAIPGPQYWRGAREAYELDRSGMLLYNTFIMDDLVEGSGMEGGGQVQIAVEDLAIKTDFASEMDGINGSATYGQLNTIGIFKGADPAAIKVVEYFLTEGYLDILGIAPFEKVPVLKSMVDEWRGLDPIFESYSEETLEHVANGYESMQRWLYRADYTDIERDVIMEMENNLLIPQVISNIALQGTMTPETGAQWLQSQVEAILAERQ